MQSVVQPESNQAKNSEQAKINYCRKALDSLKQINAKQAYKYNTSFNSLVSAASQYNSVRDQVATSTRQAVDSMYQFKAAKLCADIDKELMDSLVARGENAVR
ncbi:permease [Dryocola sp. LX212]